MVEWKSYLSPDLPNIILGSGSGEDSGRRHINLAHTHLYACRHTHYDM